jgi:hypothetical protein
MSTALQRGRLSALAPETQTAIQDTSTRAASAFSSAASGDLNVTAALEVAASVQDLRALFDRPEVKERIVALQDTAIGFRTDRDPNVTNRKTNQPNVPYSYPIVRDCAIEASLRGLQMVGNQWNIISSRQYTTKEGFEYLIRKHKAVSDFRPIIGVPKNQTGGSLVECKATWKLDGLPQNLEVVIPVKSDDWSGADQIIGKATRKFLRRCYEMMTGQSVPDAEVEVDGAASTVESPAAPEPSAAPRFPRRPRGESKADPATEVPDPASQASSPNVTPTPNAESLATEAIEASKAAPSPAPVAATNPAPAAAPDVATDPHGFIQFKLDQYGVRFDDFRDWLKSAGHFEQADSMADINDLPKAIAVRITDNGCAFLKKCCRIHGTKEVTTEGGAK